MSSSLFNGWEVVIGLEVHVQLATRSKIFSGASTATGDEPNRHASLIDLGMPGTLPVVNKEAIRNAVRFGLAINAEIGRRSVFERKNYFYPDLPKGYQTTHRRRRRGSDPPGGWHREERAHPPRAPGGRRWQIAP